ncbi:MAG: PTS sugar transporter subunit IIB [Liquorilactobacillus nagelii]|jgi:PTS system mannose-specific IIB component|uniref:PTS system mannose/fructose/N-acetylgalactosamine-transporter subunit IIB n=1 Tax=Liquorilactobacillus nagelii TaxID=82688 RepID=UPI0024313CF3|nr:PTS sugar transporter subunit IIB [Liquorilactobacillus nagelii]MCI1632738.1 PTS sugar transporter subunit IIB [Liquorilactobacillus nagelii]
MIEMLRVDERLIHGQVAVVWSKTLNITHIIVVNDSVAQNEMQQTSLKLAVPDNIKFIARSVHDSIKILSNPKAKQLKMMVVVRNFQDALAIAEKINNIKVINVGNYGLLPVNKHGKSQKEVDQTVLADEDDLKVIKEISKLEFPFESQLTPDSPKKNLKKIYR